jgi:hypothetical protein
MRPLAGAVDHRRPGSCGHCDDGGGRAAMNASWVAVAQIP